MTNMAVLEGVLERITYQGLDEATRRRTATGCTVAFLRRYLMGDPSAEALLTGREKLPDVPDVPDVVKVE
ncbi:hypothetical protein ACFRQM_06315 [Streptomyces sp. NPDC056831]|uniref:hypothetical protein n=1 Tax=Streptomyces sp. NPDC056831 TaxID=3345954 RepID=UPI0036B279BE